LSVVTTVQASNPVDAAFLARSRDDPGFRPHVGVLLRVRGGAPDVRAVRAWIAERVERMPALAYRVAVRRRRAVWEVDPGFEPGAHVREIVVADGLSSPVPAAEALLDVPFAPGSPRWGVWLIHGYAPDEWALLYRAHHGAQDGQAVADAVTALFGTGPARRTRDRGVDTCVGAADAVRMWGRVAALTVTDLVGGLRPSRTWPGAGPLTGDPRLWSASVPARWPREIAAACGGTPNDVCLAAFADALEAWGPTRAAPVRGADADVWMSLPVGLRYPHERFTVGNRVSTTRVRLYLGRTPSVARVAAITGQTLRVRSTRARAVLRAQLDLLPSAVVARVLRQGSDWRNGLDTSGLLSLSGGLSVGSDPVVSAAPLLFLHGNHPFTVGFLAWRGRVEVGVVVDRAWAGDGDLARAWAEAMERLWRAVVGDAVDVAPGRDAAAPSGSGSGGVA